jgi:hypothetical protein
MQRQIHFLLVRLAGRKVVSKPCWEQVGCPAERRRCRPAWELDSGDLCWFVNGTICRSGAQPCWKDKIALCRECPVLADLI